MSGDSRYLRLDRRSVLKLAVVGGSGTSTAGFTFDEVSSRSEFVDILSIDPSEYPTIRVNVNVDSKAGREGDLTSEDFTLIEQEVKKRIESFSFTSTALDIAFVFDDTGSMGEEIAEMKRKVKDLTTKIERAGIDSRYALVTVKDSVDIDLPFTSDADQLRMAVESLSESGGGDTPEDNFDAIETVLEFGFRDEAQKVIVDITDAVSHYRGDGSGVSDHTIGEVATDLQTQGVGYFAVAPTTDDSDASKRALANRVGGRWVDIHGGDFSVILEDITETVIASYLLSYTTDTSPGDERVVGVEVTDPVEGTGTATDDLKVPPDAGAGKSLDSLIESKQSKIESIQTTAARTMGDDEATANVDQEAQTLLDRIDSEWEDASGDEVPQYEEALERMNASEQVTQIATDGGTADGGVVDEAARDVWAIAKSLAMEHVVDEAEDIAEGIFQKLTKAVIERFNHIASDLLESVTGRGVVSSDTVSTLMGEASSVKSSVHSTASMADDDALEEIASLFGEDSIDRAISEADSHGLMTSIDDAVMEFREAIEEFLFEGAYYSHPPFPALYIPTPDELVIPDVNVSLDIPDEMIPWWLGGGSGVPDEIQFRLESGDVTLPDVPVLDDLNEVRTGADISDPAIEGINPTIDAQMLSLDGSIGDLTMQNPSTRDSVRTVGTDGINGITSLVDTINGVLEILQTELLGLAEAQLNRLMKLLPIVGAGLLLAGGIGVPVLALAVVKLGTVAAAIGSFKMLINKLQLGVGAASLPFLTQTHHVTTKALLATDIGGVTID